MSPTTTSPVPSPAEDARRQEIINQLNAKVLFHISQPVGSTGYLLLARRSQNPGDPPDQPFREAVMNVGRTNVSVRRYTDRIEAVNNALAGALPSPATSDQSSRPTSQASPSSLSTSAFQRSSSLTVTLDPYLAPAFKKELSIRKMKIPKRKIAEVEDELEEGEIREEPTSKLAFRKIGEDLTNARAAAASASSAPAPAARARTAAVVPPASAGPSHRVVKSTKVDNSTVASSSSTKPHIKENRPTRPLPSTSKVSRPPKPSPPPKLTGIMVSEEISVATSRVVTMRDILYSLSSEYVFADEVPLSGMPQKTDTSAEDLEKYAIHLRPIFAKLLNALEDEDKLQAELEIFKKLPEIINLETVPYLPERYLEEFRRTAAYTIPREQLAGMNKEKRTYTILTSIVHLNSVRIGEQESILAPIKYEGLKMNAQNSA